MIIYKQVMKLKLKKLCTLRKQAGHTHLDMSQMLNISKPFYCLIENGKRTLKYSNAVAIAKIFGMKPDEIFYEDTINITED